MTYKSVRALTQRDVMGMIGTALETQQGPQWIEKVGMFIDSDQYSETHDWLGQVPQMREWLGGLQPKGFTAREITIKNLEFEASIKVKSRNMRLDKTGSLQIRVNDLGQRANTHWAKLLSTLIENGPSEVCYDGSYFFHTAHSEGDSGTQDNDLSVDISATGVAVHGASATAPSAEEMGFCIFKAISAIRAFKDDQGEPMNEGANAFLVMVPPSLEAAALAAVNNLGFAAGATNVLANSGFKIEVVSNARLTWTAQFAVFQTDSAAKPFIRQSEQEPVIFALDATSEYAKVNNEEIYGVKATRNVGYGLWQKACLVTMT